MLPHGLHHNWIMTLENTTFSNWNSHIRTKNSSAYFHRIIDLTQAAKILSSIWKMNEQWMDGDVNIKERWKIFQEYENEIFDYFVIQSFNLFFRPQSFICAVLVCIPKQYSKMLNVFNLSVISVNRQKHIIHHITIRSITFNWRIQCAVGILVCLTRVTSQSSPCLKLSTSQFSVV